MNVELFSSADWIAGRKNVRAYVSSPIPHQHDKEIARLIKTWMALGETERRESASRISAHNAWLLVFFCERMASLAVRERDPEHLLLGLLALGLDPGKLDLRDKLKRLVLPYDAARRIGSDPEPLFESAAALLPDESARTLRAFPRRSEENKSIRVMGYQVGQDAQGFRYEDI